MFAGMYNPSLWKTEADKTSSSGRMPQAVREALVEVFEEQGKLSREQAEKYLSSIENEGRYRQETW